MPIKQLKKNPYEVDRQYVVVSKNTDFTVYKATNVYGTFYQVFNKGGVRRKQKPLCTFIHLFEALEAAEDLARL